MLLIEPSCRASASFTAEFPLATSSSSPRRQFTEEDSDKTLVEVEVPPLRAFRNQSSDLVELSISDSIDEIVSDFAGKRNNRSRDVLVLPFELEMMRSYSSIMFSRSSSVVTEIKESSSSLGSWYLSEKGRPFRSVFERRRDRSESEEWRSVTTIRVSPPT